MMENRNQDTKIKICGLSRMVDIAFANELRPDYVGFVFAESRRRVSPQKAKMLRKKLDEGIIPVGVFVNERKENILTLVSDGMIEMIQLHGQESEKDICWLKEHGRVPVIKAVSVTSSQDIKKAADTVADYLLLDQGTGGTGKPFDWSQIVACGKPFFLAGGITIENVSQALTQGAFAIDVSGGVETNGVKNREKMAAIIRAVRNRREGSKKCQREDLESTGVSISPKH